MVGCAFLNLEGSVGVENVWNLLGSTTADCKGLEENGLLNSNPLKSRSFKVNLGLAESETPWELLDLKGLFCAGVCVSSGPILILWKENPSVNPGSDVWLGAKGWKDEKGKDCLACLSLSSFSDAVKASLDTSLFFVDSKKSFSSPKILARQQAEITSYKIAMRILISMR